MFLVHWFPGMKCLSQNVEVYVLLIIVVHMSLNFLQSWAGAALRSQYLLIPRPSPCQGHFTLSHFHLELALGDHCFLVSSTHVDQCRSLPSVIAIALLYTMMHHHSRIHGSMNVGVVLKPLCRLKDLSSCVGQLVLSGNHYQENKHLNQFVIYDCYYGQNKSPPLSQREPSWAHLNSEPCSFDLSLPSRKGIVLLQKSLGKNHIPFGSTHSTRCIMSPHEAHCGTL